MGYRKTEGPSPFGTLFDASASRAWVNSVSISYFWSEKVIVLIQACQLFVFVYLANYESWPDYWRGIVEMSRVYYACFDLTTVFHEDILEDATIRSLYVAGWALIILALNVAYFLMRSSLACTHIVKLTIQKWYFHAISVLYLPAALGILPSGICSFDQCWEDWFSSVTAAVSLLIGLCFLLLWPLYFLIHARRHIYSPDPTDHALMVELKEIEYVLRLSSNWLTEKLYLITSYKLTWARVYHRGLFQLYLFALVATHAALAEYASLKLLAIAAACVFFAMYSTVVPIYRCISTSILQALCMWVVACNAVIGYLKAIEYPSETLVDSNLSSLLIALNGFSILMLVLLLSVYAIFGLNWPVDMDRVRMLAVGYRHMLIDMKNAEKMINYLKATHNYYFINPKPIKQMKGLLVDHYKLLYKENHLLQFSVLEQIDLLDWAYCRVKEQTLMPCQKLQENWEVVVSVVNRRWNQLALMNPKKRQLLLRLYMLKKFLGNRNLVPVAKPPAKLGVGSVEFDTRSNPRSMASLLSPSEPDEDFSGLKATVDALVAVGNVVQLIALTDECIRSNILELKAPLEQAWAQLGYGQLPSELGRSLREWLT